jgi:hypothetical protein
MSFDTIMNEQGEVPAHFLNLKANGDKCMIGFEDPKPGEYSIVHEEFAGQKLGDVIDIICNGGTKKELKVRTLLNMTRGRVIGATLAEWFNAQGFRENQDLELETLREAEVEDVREITGVVTVYVSMKSIGLVLGG